MTPVQVFKVGSEVYLRGFPLHRMLVEDPNAEGPKPVVACVWLDKNGDLCRASFDPVLLVPFLQVAKKKSPAPERTIQPGNRKAMT